jgi:ribonuclease HI
LIVSIRRLRPYFQAHTIKVLTEYPLKKILQKPDISGWLVNWAVELGEFDIDFLPRTTIKGQALADFLVEFSGFPEEVGLPVGDAWVACVDGLSTRKRSGDGVVIISPKGERWEFTIKLAFTTTNNEAEYEAVIAGMEVAQKLEAKILEVRSDSQVVVGHIRGEFEAQGEKMKQYLSKVQEIETFFKSVLITRVPREANTWVDFLACLRFGTTEEIKASSQQVQSLTQPSITLPINIMQVHDAEFPEWAEEVVWYLKEEKLLEDKKKSRQVRMRSARYTLIGNTLYWRGYTLPLLKCISKAKKIMSYAKYTREYAVAMQEVGCWPTKP